MSDVKSYYVYSLSDPNGGVRYIGMSQNPRARYSQHLSEAKRYYSDTPKLVWLRDLVSRGLKPVLCILGTYEDDIEASVYEQYWITNYLSDGASLVNVSLTRIKVDSHETAKRHIAVIREIKCVNSLSHDERLRIFAKQVAFQFSQMWGSHGTE